MSPNPNRSLPSYDSPAYAELQKLADNLVRNEVHLCLSDLVATLASGYGGDSTRPLSDLCDQAAELCAPLDDWEEAAIGEGWSIDGDRFVNPNRNPILQGASPLDACGWEDLCREERIDPCQREIFEHWAVSQRLAEDLAELGERVDTDFAGICVWGRTTTGQMSEMDAILLQVAQLVRDRANAIREDRA